MPSGQLVPVLRFLRGAACDSARELTDAQLLERYVLGHDEAAFTALVKRHGGLVRSVCRNVLHHDQDADDAFQATFLVFASRAGSIRKAGAVASWLHGVAYRAAMNAKRARKRRGEGQGECEARPADQPVTAAALREAQAIVDDELSRLPEKYRAPFLLCCLEGRSRAEAARELGWKEGTVSSRLAEARKRLQQRLTRRGVVLSAALCAAALSRSTATAAPALVSGTVRAALSFATGQPAVGGSVSAEALALARGVLRGSVTAPVKVATAVLLALASGVGAIVHQAVATAPPDPAPVRARSVSEGKESLADAAGSDRGRSADSFGDRLPAGALARFGTLRLHHGGPANAVAFSPDGKVVACGATYSDNDIRLWDAATGRELRSFAGHSWVITGLAFTPDGKRLVSSSGDWTARVWDVESGRELYRLVGHRGEVRDVAVAPDGATAVTAGADGTARLWDLATGKELRQLLGHQGPVEAVAFSPDGKALATAGADKSVRLWETATGQETRALANAPPDGATGVAFAPDRKTQRPAVAGSSPAGGVWRRLGANAPPDGATGVAFAPDGKTLATGDRGGTVRLWDVATGKELGSCQVARRPVQGLAFSPDGKRLACGTEWGPLSLLDPATGIDKPLDAKWTGGDFARVAFSPDGKKLLSGGGDHFAHLLDVATGKELLPLAGHHLYRVGFTADRRELFTVGNDKGRSARLWDRGTGREESAAFSPDGTNLACGDTVGAIRLYECASGSELRVLARPGAGGAISTLAYSPDGRLLASGGEDRQVRLWDAPSGKLLRTLEGHDCLVTCLAFSPDGRTLASGCRPGPQPGANVAPSDSDVRLWDVATGRPLHVLRGHKWGIEALAFSPDGKALASAAREETVRVWDVADGKELSQLKAHKPWVYCLAFSPDGRMLATGGLDNEVRLWEVRTWGRRARFEGHRGGVVGLAFAADGRTLASGAGDCTALLWDVSGRGGRPPVALSPSDLEAAWTDLGGPDAARAYRAVADLAASPAQALPLLRGNLHPVPPLDADKLRRLVARLDQDDHDVREGATRDLIGFGDAAEPALRSALEGTASAEQRQRLIYVLGRLKDEAASAGRLRAVRALEVLERIGTPDARDVLQALAGGAPEVEMSRGARAALNHLSKRRD
jgi:RNA polymerase sigma factor (sigma-70 family)